MIREGHVIEFNDGSLDLPRAKPPKKEASEVTADLPDATAAVPAETAIAITETATATTETAPTAAEAAASATVIPSEVEGSRGERSDETSSQVLSSVIPSRED